MPARAVVFGAMSGRTARWLATALLWLGFSAAEAAPFDAAAFRTIPLIEVIRLATVRYQWIDFGDDASRRERLGEMGALDPDVQTLAWLAVLESGMSEQTEANDFAPSSFSSMGLSFQRIAKALADAGMGGRAAAFETAAAGNAGPGGSPVTIDLGSGFGTKADFDAAIVDYVRAKPVVAAWCASARAKLSDDDRLRTLLDALASRDASDEELMGWPEPYRVLVLAGVFDSEVGNGGVHQYFYNSSGDLAPETVAAMRSLDLPRHADTILEGMALFETPYPKNREKRMKAFAHDGFTEWDKRLEALTDIVGYDAVRPAMTAYAERLDLLPR